MVACTVHLLGTNFYNCFICPQGSLSVIVNEDSTVVLEIARMGGAFGLVSVAWEISGSHEDGEITPSQGTVSN